MTSAIDIAAVADWLCTFAMHSTLALAFAWLVGVGVRSRALVFQEGILRLSLWAALVSSSVQYFGLGSPWPFALSLPSAAAASVAVPTGDEVAVLAALSAATPVDEPLVHLSWPTVVVAAAGGLALLGIVWLWCVHRRLQYVLSQRRPEVDGRVLATAAEVARGLGLRQSPHVSRCDRIATPIAFGWLRPEICLPARAGELADGSLRAMLAHEIAHLRRGDPAWMWFAAWLQALFPWQLLMPVVRRRWARLIELRCDAIAARHSSPTAVARCLLDVAEWLRPGAPTPLVALGMAARASSLRERVEAALQPRSASPPHSFVSMAFCGVSLSALTLVAPGMQATSPPFMPLAEALRGVVVAPDVVAAPSATSALHAAAQLMQQEHIALTAEVARLRADLAGRPAPPELEQLVSMLTHRLLVLERLSARLQARLDRRIVEAR